MQTGPQPFSREAWAPLPSTTHSRDLWGRWGGHSQTHKQVRRALCVRKRRLASCMARGAIPIAMCVLVNTEMTN